MAMHINQFYTLDTNNAVSLHLVALNQWENVFAGLTAVERNFFAAHQFKGKLGELCLIYNADGLISKVYVGSGDGNQEQALAHAALLLPVGRYQCHETVGRNAALNWALAQYQFTAYKKQEIQASQLVLTQTEITVATHLAQAIFIVRDLVNTPANDMGPQHLAAALEQLAKQHKGQFSQWIGEELLKHNFPAIHAVGRASLFPPRLLSLTWGNEEHPRVTLVGKGVCFDTGGLDIKPSSGMRLMKKDMGGAAHVIGLAQWIMQQKLPIRLEVLIPAVENAIGPDAFRPGDVLTMRNGLTVEIDNTDAEGRLILADALTKACEDKPDLIIDFATLTGAARVALGTEIAAMFSNNDALADAMINDSYKANEAVWRMPLHAAYNDLLKSNIADLVNASTSSFGGAITAALFLQRFINAEISWLHFDVMAWNVSTKPGKPEGGEALGLRTVAEYLLRVYG
jgi:leucyl aminopeptidase